MQLFDFRARRSVDEGLHRFFEARVAFFGFEEAGARQEQLAVEFQDLEEFGG